MATSLMAETLPKQTRANKHGGISLDQLQSCLWLTFKLFHPTVARHRTLSIFVILVGCVHVYVIALSFSQLFRFCARDLKFKT